MFRRLFASLPAIVFGVLIAVAPQAFAHVCEVKDNMPMACHYTAQAVLIGVCKGAMMHCHMVTRPTLIVIGILALLFAVVAIYLDSKPVKR